MERLVGTLSAEKTLVGELSVPKTMSRHQYKGDYEVEPGWEEKELQTKDMYMTNNVVVKKNPDL